MARTPELTIAAHSFKFEVESFLHELLEAQKEVYEVRRQVWLLNHERCKKEKHEKICHLV